MLEKTEGAIKNGQSRDTGSIGHTRHITKVNKKKKPTTTQKTSNYTPENKKEEQHGPHQKPRRNPGARDELYDIFI
jgi:hypothetical protein